MKEKFKRANLTAFSRALESVGQSQSTRFAYAVAKNKKAIQAEVEAIQAAVKPPDWFNDYERQRMGLVQQHALKDKNGQMIQDGNTARIGNMQKFQEELEALQAKFKDPLEELKKKDEEARKFVEEEVEVELYEIQTKYLPKDLKADDLFILMPAIVGDIKDMQE
jgi:hypothetical protein